MIANKNQRFSDLLSEMKKQKTKKGSAKMSEIEITIGVENWESVKV